MRLHCFRCGSLFDTAFVEKMEQAARKLSLSVRLETLLHGMWLESRCPLEDEPEIKCGPTANGDVTCTPANGKASRPTGVQSGSDKDVSQGMCEKEGRPEKKTTNDGVEESGDIEKSAECADKCKSGGCQKRKPAESGQGEPAVKKPKRESRVPDDAMPFFYYDIHRRKIKGYDIPK